MDFETRYQKLIKKIDIGLSASGLTHTLGSEQNASDRAFKITKDFDIEKLSPEKLILSHSLLHFLHSRGGTKELSSRDIVNVHKKVKEKLGMHKRFDRLDDE